MWYFIFTFLNEIKIGSCKKFLDLLLSTTSIEYIKLIVSSLNYSNPGITRLILETALTATDDQSRKWCTRFLGVLAGSNVIPDFEKYGMKLLISQLGDSNVKVVRHAVRLLHVWLPKYPAALDILARTSLEPLGSAGILLKAHLFGSEKLVQAMEEDAKEALEYWMENYQKEYVNIIEEDMRAALLNVRRSIDGSFARPSSEKFEKFGVPMPVHIFSQLASHQVGRSMLVDASIPSKLLKTLIESGVVEEDEILDVKAALLSIGHISSNLPNGMIEVMFPAETIPIVCRYAEECPTLSVRGTAIWALNLVGKSEDGARILASLGWESNRHVHVIDQVCEEFCERIKSKSQSRRPSRIGYRWINCIDGSKQNMRKSLSSSDLSNEEQSTWKKQNSLNQEGSSPIALERRRLHSDSRLDLPFLFLKKGHRKHEKLTATKSMPQSSDEVRPDRTFTHESAVTSGFGSVSQDEAKQTESMTDLPPPSLPQLDQRTEFFSKLDEPKDPKRRFPFAPSTLPDFINPVVPNTLPFSLGFGESSALAVSFESEKSDHLPEMASVDRRRVALSELRNQPHFSALYRKHYGIQGFDQECILTIPNRTHSHVYYSFLSKAEMKNIEKYERILTAAGEWVPTEPLPDGPKAMATVVGWTVVSLPSEVGLICKNIFKSIRKTRTIEDSGSLERSSAHRCFYCSRRIAKGLSTNHFHSLDSKMRTDVLEFVSLFEIRANALQKSLTKKYGRQLQTCFENPCLYSDALELLADLNYSRKSRREIHKIFSKAIGFFPANYG